MKVRAQIGMVLNLDKCIGCHTCSVTCKNVWTSRPGVEYAWFNNVETKPGIGYPKEWENQDKWNGGWVRKADGSIVPKQGGKWSLLMKIFSNPNLPQIDDYYEPFTFDYDHLQSAPEVKAAPTARPRSLITGQRMEKIEWGPNWEEILGGEFSKRSQDANLANFEQARADGIPESWLEGARNSPVYKMAIDWKVALPLHPEYRTLPMVWYVPPLSPISAAANAGQIGANGELPDFSQMRIPLQYLANLLTAGDTGPVVRALERMLAMRAFQRGKHVDGVENVRVLEQVGLTRAQVEEMYHVMAIANYEDRFVIPSSHREYAENAFDLRGGCGFSFGNGCSDGASETSLFGGSKRRTIPIQAAV